VFSVETYLSLNATQALGQVYSRCRLKMDQIVSSRFYPL